MTDPSYGSCCYGGYHGDYGCSGCCQYHSAVLLAVVTHGGDGSYSCCGAVCGVEALLAAAVVPLRLFPEAAAEEQAGALEPSDLSLCPQNVAAEPTQPAGPSLPLLCRAVPQRASMSGRGPRGRSGRQETGVQLCAEGGSAGDTQVLGEGPEGQESFQQGPGVDKVGGQCRGQDLPHQVPDCISGVRRMKGRGDVQRHRGVGQAGWG